MSDRRPRLLVFVIAYYAEATLKNVLERIPRSLFETYDCTVLVVDDASQDRTWEIGREYKAAHPEVPMTVLRNQYNQGYGGNQKVGYAFAVAEGFDFVAMVHGDAQYAPEELPRLVEPLARGEADAVLGSRMMHVLSALKGGMPYYKYLGNRILTTTQNILLGSRLAEFHTGYRVYSVAALARLPIDLNTNAFHFDTEILIQLLNAGCRIAELPIPTHYGDEICRVDGIRYARDVFRVTLQDVFHRMGVLYQRRFDTAPPTSRYDLKLGYPSSHTYALEAVVPGSRVVDIGGGPPGWAEELLSKGCTVSVIGPARAEELPAAVEVHPCDLDSPLECDLRDCDTLLLLDVIEHRRDPEAFLRGLRRLFDHRPRRLILTTPNVGFIIPRLMLLLGQFNYGRAGILDRTHTRLFTFGSILRLLRDHGFRLQRVRGVPAPFPKALGQGALARVALAVNRLLIRLSRSLFAYQIYVVSTTTPDVEFVLRDAKASSEG